MCKGEGLTTPSRLCDWQPICHRGRGRGGDPRRVSGGACLCRARVSHTPCVYGTHACACVIHSVVLANCLDEAGEEGDEAANTRKAVKVSGVVDRVRVSSDCRTCVVQLCVVRLCVVRRWLWTWASRRTPTPRLTSSSGASEAQRGTHTRTCTHTHTRANIHTTIQSVEPFFVSGAQQPARGSSSAYPLSKPSPTRSPSLCCTLNQ
jgi:hypothetical protein